MDAMNISTVPVVFSHSNAYTIHQHPRNLKDDQIKACAMKKGVIGINGVGTLLGDKNASIQKYVEHIDYIAQLVGCEYVALGIDQIYFPEIMEQYLRDNAVLFNQSYTQSFGADVPKNKWESIGPNQIISIVDLLLQRGYSKTDIRGILGENYLRVVEKVCDNHHQYYR
jgi:membrane dipeptidase